MWETVVWLSESTRMFLVASRGLKTITASLTARSSNALMLQVDRAGGQHPWADNVGLSRWAPQPDFDASVVRVMSGEVEV